LDLRRIKEPLTPFLLQEKFRAKGKKLYFGFMDLEKAFDRFVIVMEALSREFKVTLSWEILYVE